MRISDWSADVCSSDLRIEVHEEGGIAVLVNLVAPGLRETPFSLLQRTHQSSARDRIVSPGNYRNTCIRIETTYAICPDPVSRLFGARLIVLQVCNQPDAAHFVLVVQLNFLHDDLGGLSGVGRAAVPPPTGRASSRERGGA